MGHRVSPSFSVLLPASLQPPWPACLCQGKQILVASPQFQSHKYSSNAFLNEEERRLSYSSAPVLSLSRCWAGGEAARFGAGLPGVGYFGTGS